MSSINFAMQQQAQTGWCWAAVSSSVDAFYNPASTWTQCKIVNSERGLTDCCTNGSSASCNQGWYLDKALTRVGHYARTTGGTKTLLQIDTACDNKTPLCIGIRWASGGGHFLGLSGHYMSNNVEYVTVRDPWYGQSDVAYDTLQTKYQGSGTWIYSYETKA